MEKEYQCSIFRLGLFWVWLLSIGPFLYLILSRPSAQLAIISVYVLFNLYWMISIYKSLYFVVIKRGEICIRHDLDSSYQESVCRKDISSIEIEHVYKGGSVIVIETKLGAKRWNISGLSGDDLRDLKDQMTKTI